MRRVAQSAQQEPRMRRHSELIAWQRRPALYSGRPQSPSSPGIGVWGLLLLDVRGYNHRSHCCRPHRPHRPHHPHRRRYRQRHHLPNSFFFYIYIFFLSLYIYFVYISIFYILCVRACACACACARVCVIILFLTYCGRYRAYQFR